jgi:hypothetical protein
MSFTRSFHLSGAYVDDLGSKLNSVQNGSCKVELRARPEFSVRLPREDRQDQPATTGSNATNRSARLPEYDACDMSPVIRGVTACGSAGNKRGRLSQSGAMETGVQQIDRSIQHRNTYLRRTFGLSPKQFQALR